MKQLKLNMFRSGTSALLNTKSKKKIKNLNKAKVLQDLHYNTKACNLKLMRKAACVKNKNILLIL